jgi:hypothetical protein
MESINFKGREGGRRATRVGREKKGGRGRRRMGGEDEGREGGRERGRERGASLVCLSTLLTSS